MISQPPLESPYPGLRPFQKCEWPTFFGREPMIDAVLDHLAAYQLVVVHGSSGCGKSSLIRAGVLPRLEQEHSRYGVPWRTAEMRPGGSPLWNLATAIARLVEKIETDDEPSLANTRTIRRLLNGRNALSRIQERFKLGKEGNVCVLLDQFEELFRYAREIGTEEAEVLVKVLRGFERGQEDAGRRSPKGVYVIVTMRSDHLGDCGHFEGFAELVNATQYLLPRIPDAALLRAIREPARLFGGEVSVDLAVRLIDESRAKIDALPLVQHALMRLWREASRATDEPSKSSPLKPSSALRPVLTAEAYHGLETLLSEHAEEILKEVASEHPANEKIVEYLFRAITEVDTDGRRIRRPQRLSQLVEVTSGDVAALERVVRRFSQPDCGFLVRSLGDDPIIDIGHEALIRCWRKLDDPAIDATGRPKGWLQREREDQRTWRAMLVQAEAGDRISPAVLRDREAWFNYLPGPAWADRYEGGWEKIRELLESSRNAARRARLVRIGGAFFVLLSAAVFSWWTIGVTPRDGLMMLALQMGLTNPAPEMIELPAGFFLMGSPKDEPGRRFDEGPQHEVAVPEFAIGKYEVTFDAWDLCVADGGCPWVYDQGWGRGRRPVINVSWENALAYAEWLSKVTGENYRLPSEAEWEYAARAGTTTSYSWGNDEPTSARANFGGDEGQTREVGSYPSNPWGIHEMHGNVWEWVEDCWNESYNGEDRPDNGSAWLSGGCDRRVLRGGSWSNRPEGIRSAGRYGGIADDRSPYVGFRVARTLR